ncbi:DUF397 domain-containing protein [Actinomycetospora soli]|uniref:DUF397 domain-containing protein n=1 Tax=Actinomycetospora soli TaxID=2893887 RepID=UPI001E454292|nr:DUF397 domain-containing protein [Actinomycetospora soli]MCD2190006.1 DUF397 domain-containing protein [Actinomycetospora soli]
MHTTASHLTGAAWRRSRRSGKQGNCVELAAVGSDGYVAVRNSRFPDDAALLLTRAELGAFLSDVRAGRFDDLLGSA